MHGSSTYVTTGCLWKQTLPVLWMSLRLDVMLGAGSFSISVGWSPHRLVAVKSESIISVSFPFQHSENDSSLLPWGKNTESMSVCGLYLMFDRCSMDCPTVGTWEELWQIPLWTSTQTHTSWVYPITCSSGLWLVEAFSKSSDLLVYGSCYS